MTLPSHPTPAPSTPMPTMTPAVDTSAAASILALIVPGARVTIRTRHGQELTGKAVMRGPAGWVLDMGGRHGRPDIACDANIVKVRVPRASRAPQVRGGGV